MVEALRPDAPATASMVQAVIAGRLTRLSPEAAAVAGVAAAVGRAFTADVLAAAAGLDEQAFVAALDELWRRGILRAHGPNAYDFSHGRIRDAAYAALGPPRRRQLHLEIARALEVGEHPAAAAIAPHYEQAGATAQAIRWYERAAEAAQWLHAHADAVRALERALSLSGQLPAGPGTAALQLRLLTALPAPLLTLEGYASERMALMHTRALQLAGQLGSEPEPPLVWSLAMAALTRGEWEPARGFAGRLRARAERDDDQVLWVESDYLRGIAAYWPGRLTEARGHFEAAMERFRPEHRRAHVLRYGQDPELLVRLRLAHTLWLLGHPAEADRQRDLALARPPSPATATAARPSGSGRPSSPRTAARSRSSAATSGSSPPPRRTKVPPRSGWRPSCSSATLPSLTAERIRVSSTCARSTRSSPQARPRRPACPASPPACCSRAMRWPTSRRPASRWPARRSVIKGGAWAAARSSGRPRSDACARPSWPPAAPPPSRSRPNSSARSRWPSAKRHARSSNESWKRSRNALLARVVPGR